MTTAHASVNKLVSKIWCRDKTQPETLQNTKQHIRLSGLVSTTIQQRFCCQKCLCVNFVEFICCEAMPAQINRSKFKIPYSENLFSFTLISQFSRYNRRKTVGVICFHTQFASYKSDLLCKQRNRFSDFGKYKR